MPTSKEYFAAEGGALIMPSELISTAERRMKPVANAFVELLRAKSRYCSLRSTPFGSHPLDPFLAGKIRGKV